MTAGYTRATARSIIDDWHAVTARTAPTAPLKLRVETAQGTTTAGGTELGSTTFPTIAWTAATAADPPVGASSGAITITAGAGGTIVAAAVWDTAGTPYRIEYGPLASSRTLVTGDALAFATAAVTMSLSSP